MCVRRCRGLRFGFREKEISGSREQFLQGPGMWNSKEFLGLGVQAGPGSVTGQQLSFGSYGINPCKMLAISKRMYGRSILGIGRVDENVFLCWLRVYVRCFIGVLFKCILFFCFSTGTAVLGRQIGGLLRNTVGIDFALRICTHTHTHIHNTR